MILFLNINKFFIPIIPAILWLEINIYGKTYLPESLCIIQVLLYLYWRWLWWRLMSKTKKPLREKGYI